MTPTSRMILVTGATGFVGRGLVAHLRSLGIPVRAAVRAGEDVAVGDIGPDTDWSHALEGVDSVVHLAGRAHVMARERDALAQFRRVNTAGTERLARQAEAAGVRRFVLLSSVKAAADTTGEHALLETDPASPRTPYGISKLEGEQALWAEVRRTEAVVLRPPLVYGPGVKANFRALLRLVDSGLPLPLGAVSNRRSVIRARQSGFRHHYGTDRLGRSGEDVLCDRRPADFDPCFLIHGSGACLWGSLLG